MNDAPSPLNYFQTYCQSVIPMHLNSIGTALEQHWNNLFLHTALIELHIFFLTLSRTC